MKLYDVISPFLEQLDCQWTASTTLPCIDLTFGDSNFSIRFSLNDSLVDIVISMDETYNQSTSKSMFASNLCTEIIYGTADFVFDLHYEEQLLNYLKDRGVESLLDFNKTQLLSECNNFTYTHKIFEDKIYQVSSENHMKQILMSETKYTKSLLYMLVTFNENKDNILTMRSHQEHNKAVKDFRYYIETQSSKGMRSLFMYNRLQNNVPDARKDSMKRTKI